MTNVELWRAITPACAGSTFSAPPGVAQAGITPAYAGSTLLDLLFCRSTPSTFFTLLRDRLRFGRSKRTAASEATARGGLAPASPSRRVVRLTLRRTPDQRDPVKVDRLPEVSMHTEGKPLLPRLLMYQQSAAGRSCTRVRSASSAGGTPGIFTGCLRRGRASTGHTRRPGRDQSLASTLAGTGQGPRLGAPRHMWRSPK